ncbi:MAG: histidine phosphatase family protein [Bacteroidota bacterium]
MKKLILVRHAKSSWRDISLRDHDRPLNGRGKRDGPFMARLLAARHKDQPILVSSTANRAYTTAKYFAEAFGQSEAGIRLEDAIYEASTMTLQQVIAGLKPDWDTVVLFGHNPGFTMLANLFYGDKYIDNLPTCGIVEILGEEVTDWNDFSPTTAQVTAIHYPKQYV